MQIFHLDVAYVWNGFQVFSRVFASVSDACFKCFICLQMLVANILSKCFKSRSGIAHVTCDSPATGACCSCQGVVHVCGKAKGCSTAQWRAHEADGEARGAAWGGPRLVWACSSHGRLGISTVTFFYKVFNHLWIPHTPPNHRKVYQTLLLQFNTLAAPTLRSPLKFAIYDLIKALLYTQF